LEAAGRHRNFTRAADELGLTPAAVSHVVKEFQDQLGVMLFERSGREMRHTPVGETVHVAARNALRELDSAAARVKKLSASLGLRVSAPTSFAQKWLLPSITKFRLLRPDVAVDIDITKDFPDFERDRIDVAFRWGDGDYPGRKVDIVIEHAIFPVCSPQLLSDLGRFREPRDLLGHNLIHVTWGEAGVFWPDWQAWFTAAGVHEYEDRPGLHLHETVHAVQAAIEGQGVALGDASLVAEDLAAGRLVRPFELSIKAPGTYAYYMTTPLESENAPLIQSFREWILLEAAH
jgi:LysR family glycine cleavage system transcriptional activator